MKAETIEQKAKRIYADNIYNNGSSPSVASIVQWLRELEHAQRTGSIR